MLEGIHCDEIKLEMEKAEMQDTTFCSLMYLRRLCESKRFYFIQICSVGVFTVKILPKLAGSVWNNNPIFSNNKR